MNEEKIKKMINEYLDGELNVEDENHLFSILSTDTEAREYFKTMNKFKVLVSQSLEEFPDILDERIIKRTEAKSGNSSVHINFVNVFKYGIYTLLLIFGFVGYVLFENVNYQSDQLNAARKTVQNQKEIIELITSNQLSPVTVESELNSVIIKAD